MYREEIDGCQRGTWGVSKMDEGVKDASFQL